MAEAVVFHVIEKIGTALGQEALNMLCLQHEIKVNMSDLRHEFSIMKDFLAEQQKVSSHSRTYDTWIDQVRTVAHNAEDIIDEYTYMIRIPKKGCKLNRLFSRFTNLGEWHDIAKQLKQIEVSLQKLMSSRDRYGISVSKHKEGSILRSESYQELWSVSTYFVSEEDIVGKKEESTQLTQLLMHGSKTRNVISILGMGGIGKTTLARSIYKNKEIESVFDCIAWITISQNYKIEVLLRGILRQVLEKKGKIPVEIDTMDKTRLVERLRSCLEDKKYLVFLDDMWNQDAWTLLNCALVSNNKGSRVLITTRIEGVALIANNECCIVPKKLPLENAWKLFCQKAFQKVDGKRCPEALIPWAEKIVERCDGLPLAIVAIGSLLSYKKIDEKEWEMFYSQLSWYITKNQELNHITTILSLSINNLPVNLKNCFMYCSMFPEDYVIRRKQIIRLWVAEGFVEERGDGITKEEVADEYLKDLVHRSLLQVVQRNLSGRPNGFQMHDLVREIIVAKCKGDRFSVVAEDPRMIRLGYEARRVSVLKGADAVESVVGAKTIRSFILFDKEVTSVWIKSAIANFRLLTVLSLRDANIEKLPDSVMDLFNLSYLDLRGSKVKVIPKSVGRLRQLQVLDLTHTPVMELPAEIMMLTRLRLLRVGGFHDFVGVNRAFLLYRPTRICSVIDHQNDLQVLGQILPTEDVVSNLARLTQLRNLAIHIEKVEYVDKLCTALRSMPNLVFLVLILSVEDHVLNLQQLDHIPSLRSLQLRGALHGGVVPPVLRHFINLTILQLEWSRLQVDPLPSISCMLNLHKLYLEKAYDGLLLTFREGWFPMLKELILINMENLIIIEMEAGTMPKLVYLALASLISMHNVPPGLQHITSLQWLIFRDMPGEIIRRARGEDRLYIQHICKVHLVT